MKLWQKNIEASADVTSFTVGADRQMDLFLAKADVLGSLAHIQMLESVGLLEKKALALLQVELKSIYQRIADGKFEIEDGVEDVHSQVEMILTEKSGDTGKRIHSGRSRNDQVMVDIRIFLREEIKAIVDEIHSLFKRLIALSDEHKDKLLPGYTHQQLAMPSSFGLWFGAFAEALVDDVTTLRAAYEIVNKNPLGSAAGYGSSFPLNRRMTTSLLGFDELNYNVVYAQMGRGKTEKIVAAAMSNVAGTLGKLATDAVQYLNQNFSFISFPDELTTGSSIMPHKKNPDVFELIRGKCNTLQALPNEIALITANMPSGYHRDWQLLKESLFPAIITLKDCLRMTTMMLGQIVVKDDILKDEKYKYLFSVEEVNKLVLKGVPFRDAYRQIGLAIENGTFVSSLTVHHTHEGSIGNLCNDEIVRMMKEGMDKFGFDRASKAIQRLLS